MITVQCEACSQVFEAEQPIEAEAWEAAHEQSCPRRSGAVQARDELSGDEKESTG